jgi:hypothetical protein
MYNVPDPVPSKKNAIPTSLFGINASVLLAHGAIVKLDHGTVTCAQPVVLAVGVLNVYSNGVASYGSFVNTIIFTGTPDLDDLNQKDIPVLLVVKSMRGSKEVPQLGSDVTLV